MKPSLSLCLPLLVFMPLLAIAQPTSFFDVFHGTVYDIPPGDYLQKGYGDYVESFDILGYTTLKSLNVPKSFVYDKYFPGVTMREFFGIIFLSSLTITEKGCFEFYLESDDGSKLWIGDSLVIDNDKMHKMIAMRDTMYLDKGKYDVKVWYYSALPSQFGLILKSRTMPDSVECKAVKKVGIKRKLNLDRNNVFFDLNSSVITPAGIQELDTLCNELNQSEVMKIQIVGFTDTVGTVEYNADLSLKRAQSIAGYIKSKLLNKSIVIEAEGRGEHIPVVPNEKASGMASSRRVEIYIE